MESAVTFSRGKDRRVVSSDPSVACHNCQSWDCVDFGVWIRYMHVSSDYASETMSYAPAPLGTEARSLDGQH
jgi:hypothetical protein